MRKKVWCNVVIADSDDQRPLPQTMVSPGGELEEPGLDNEKVADLYESRDRESIGLPRLNLMFNP